MKQISMFEQKACEEKVSYDWVDWVEEKDTFDETFLYCTHPPSLSELILNFTRRAFDSHTQRIIGTLIRCQQEQIDTHIPKTLNYMSLSIFHQDHDQTLC